MSTRYAPSIERQPASPPAVVRISGEQDCSTIEALTQSFASAFASHDDTVVVDLSDVSFMDSSTVHLLHRIRDTLARSGRTLILRRPSPQAARTLSHIEAIQPQGFIIELSSSHATVSAVESSPDERR